MPTRVPRALAALLVVFLLAASEAPARAEDASTIALGVVVGGVDLGFGIYDTTVLARKQLPAHGAAVAEIIVALPQVGLAHIGQPLLVGTAGAEDDPKMAALALLPGVADSMLVHGLWGATTTTARPDVLYGVSAAVGFDTALTTAAIFYATCGRTEGRALGAGAMILTAPQIAVSSWAMVKDPANRAGWGALAGWSGAHFAYGLTSIFVNRPTTCGERVFVPPPAPPKPALLVPGSIRLGPAAYAGAPGLVLQGSWL